MPKRTTFEQIASLWKTEKEQFVKQSTIAAYSYILELHILPAFGGKTLVSENDVQQFINSKAAAGLSRKSIHDILVVLKMILEYANHHDLMEYKPMELHLPPQKGESKLLTMNLKEQKKLIEYVKAHLSLESLGLLICLFCGLRVGEICALKWSDLDAENNLLHIRKTLQRIYVYEGDEKHTELIYGTPKSQSSAREVPVPDRLVNALVRLRNGASDDDFLLSGRSTPIEPRVYRTFFKRLLRRAGLPDIKFHALRHSFATRCIDGQCDYKTVSSLLGHSNISTTINLYVHPNLDQKRKVVETMTKVLE